MTQALLENTVGLLAKRVDGIDKELLEPNKDSLGLQKHLDRGSSERLYWHAGYASALRDILEMLQKNASRA